MYSVIVITDFIAQHFLTVPDPGSEGELHSQHYEVEVELLGDSVNEHGYLVDIDEVRAVLDALTNHYEDKILNDLAEFDGENPSVERFARNFCDRFLGQFDAPNVDRIRVTVWEDETAAAAYEQPL